jgi:hypothetical protein
MNWLEVARTLRVQCQVMFLHCFRVMPWWHTRDLFAAGLVNNHCISPQSLEDVAIVDQLETSTPCSGFVTQRHNKPCCCAPSVAPHHCQWILDVKPYPTIPHQHPGALHGFTPMQAISGSVRLCNMLLGMLQQLGSARTILGINLQEICSSWHACHFHMALTQHARFQGHTHKGIVHTTTLASAE